MMPVLVPVLLNAAIDAIIEKESMTCVVIAHRLNTVRAARSRKICSFCLACHRHPDYADTMLVLVSSPGVREQIKAADMIVVFEDGVLLEQGTHDALVNDGGLYAQLAGHKSTRD